ncbi:MAG TPA: hypothetical protein VMF08_12560 [Candidatus Sulfotelmatobacter sp.]|nr:hypothetical protein [Candidatus Sulfotelmatobacter sp.]
MAVAKLKDFLDREGVKYAAIAHSLAFTMQEVAASAHIPGKQLAKPDWQLIRRWQGKQSARRQITDTRREWLFLLPPFCRPITRLLQFRSHSMFGTQSFLETGNLQPIPAAMHYGLMSPKPLSNDFIRISS